MLESVTLRSEDLSLARIAEALIYYGRVVISGNVGAIIEVAGLLGPTNLQRLIELGSLQLSHEQGMTGVAEDPRFPGSHEFVQFKNGPGPLFEIVDQWVKHKNYAGRPVGPVALNLIKKYVVELGEPSRAIQNAMRDVSDHGYLENVIREIVSEAVPYYKFSDRFYAKCMIASNRITLLTNLDFEEIERLRIRAGNPFFDTPITRARILAQIIGVQELMFYHGGTRTDIWTTQLQSRVIVQKVSSIFRRLSFGNSTINRFHEIIFEGRTFADRFRSGEKSVNDLVDFLEHPDTQRFKQLILTAPENGEIIREYDKAMVSEEPLFQDPKFKTIKMIVTNSIDLVAPPVVGKIIGVGTSLFEDYAMSNIKLGWRPNQWVDRTAKPFLGL